MTWIPECNQGSEPRHLAARDRNKCYLTARAKIPFLVTFAVPMAVKALVNRPVLYTSVSFFNISRTTVLLDFLISKVKTTSLISRVACIIINIFMQTLTYVIQLLTTFTLHFLFTYVNLFATAVHAHTVFFWPICFTWK